MGNAMCVLTYISKISFPARILLAVDARSSGKTSLLTLAICTTSLLQASDDSARPTRAILVVSRRFR